MVKVVEYTAKLQVRSASMSRAVKKLGESFYRRTDVTVVARDLLGKILVTCFDGRLTSGRIVETEAYTGVDDRASHAYGGRRNARLEPLYAGPGTVYMYICYGLHHLFNVVTNKTGIPHVVLVRALEPLDGIDTMLERTGRIEPGNNLTRGPGNMSRALGLSKMHSSGTLLSNEIYIQDDGTRYKTDEVRVTTRIGIDGAGADSLLPYRYIVVGSKWVSGRKS